MWEPESLPLCNSIPISTNPIAISFLQLGPNSAIPIPNWDPYRNCKSKSGPAPQYWSLDWGGSFYWASNCNRGAQLNMAIQFEQSQFGISMNGATRQPGSVLWASVNAWPPLASHPATVHRLVVQVRTAAREDELGGVTITRGDLTSPGPLQKACTHIAIVRNR